MNGAVTRMTRRERRLLAVIIAAGCVLGIAYALVIRPGLPADEASHFDTVRYYAHFRNLPATGHRGVTYEAVQQGPVYYVLSALPYGVLRLIRVRTAFFGLRLLNVLTFVPIVALLSFRIARRLTDSNTALTAAALSVVTPGILAVASSVQNDGLVIIFGLVAIYYFLRWAHDEPLTMPRAAIIGAIVGLGMLTKSSLAFLALAIPVWLVVRYRKEMVRQAVAFVAAVAVISGWWFVRNRSLYGDFTAQGALASVGFHKPPVWRLSQLPSWIRSFTSWYGAPKEHLRGAFHAAVLSLWFPALVVVALVGAVLCWRQRESRGADAAHGSGHGVGAVRSADAWFLAFAGIACLSVYAALSLTVTGFQPRLTFPGYISVAIALAAGAACAATAVLGKRGPVVIFALVSAGLVVINIAIVAMSSGVQAPLPHNWPS